MAGSSIAELHVETDLPDPASPMRQMRRRIDMRAGRAFEILGHAIEYLTDEYVHEFTTQGRGSFPAADGPTQAIQLLIAASRKIYFECPEVEDLATRCLSILRGRRHRKAESVAGPARAQV
jgi:hypothetical protein